MHRESKRCTKTVSRVINFSEFKQIKSVRAINRDKDVFLGFTARCTCCHVYKVDTTVVRSICMFLDNLSLILSENKIEVVIVVMKHQLQLLW